MGGYMMWVWLAQTTPDFDPTGWITQAGLGALVVFMGFVIRWGMRKLDKTEDRVFDVLPLTARLEETLRTLIQQQTASIESTNRHTVALEAHTTQIKEIRAVLDDLRVIMREGR